MFDALKSAPHPIDEPAPDWRQTLGYGDIVLFAFPVAEPEAGAPPKVRPCLVLEADTALGGRHALLAYGTSAMTGANRGYEVHVRREEDARACGLQRPTRFVGARRLLVPLTHAGFPVCAAGTPVVGRLDGALFERMNAVRARIQAEADIAAERRAERRREVLEARRSRRRLSPRPTVALRRTKARAVAPLRLRSGR